jgi:hypothetical protein
MIQRIQTLFLMVAAVAMGLTLFTPIWSKTGAGQQVAQLTAQNLSLTTGNTAAMEQPVIYISITAVISLIMSIVSILQFKNRKLQMMLGAINSLMIGLTLGGIIYSIFKLGIPLFEPNMQGNYDVGFYAASVGFFANWGANRFIRRDEMLVRSADRMR